LLTPSLVQKKKEEKSAANAQQQHGAMQKDMHARASPVARPE